MTELDPFPLFERRPADNARLRIFSLILLLLLLCLLSYRCVFLNSHGFSWLLAFSCELWFTFYSIIAMISKWSPVDYFTYPDRLLQRVKHLPPVDIFVTTADPELEPPIITANTVISVLAVDYPADKLACYVSDDGCSPITFYALVEASKFAQLWVPFCKKYQVKVRAPFQYFSNMLPSDGNAFTEFSQESLKMRGEYEILCHKIQAVASESTTPFTLTEDFEVFSNITRQNHPGIVKVICENKEARENGIPHLVYVSREKCPTHPHHYKGGAMNALIRVSGVMTNAPFMLNVDCDMYANNPQALLQAMCLHLGCKDERDVAFVQTPQKFYNGLKDDPLANQHITIQHFWARGMVGLQGSIYSGTGCVHRRKVIYGLSRDDVQSNGETIRKFGEEELEKRFGKSEELKETAATATSSAKYRLHFPRQSISPYLEIAKNVICSDYEHDTLWGREVGLIYGSTAEDANTGLKIHSRGWSSLYNDPDPPAFVGCTPTSVPVSLIQQKRWATGLLETLTGKVSPIRGVVFGQLQIRTALAYLYLSWALRSIPELCYTTLPAYCLITNTSVLPKVDNPALAIPVVLVILYYMYSIWEYHQTGQSTRAWWNAEKMWLITTTSAWLFALFSVGLKVFGISETVFEVTRKGDDENGDSCNDDDKNGGDPGRFTFDDSPMFIPGTTILLLNFTSLGLAFWRLVTDEQGYYSWIHGDDGVGVGEATSCVWVLLHFWPFLKGLRQKGKYGIPTTTLYKSAALVVVFCAICVSL